MKVMTSIGLDVLANTSSLNLLDGKAEVYLSRNSALAFYLTAEAAGLFATILVGDSVVVQDQEVSAANRFPIRPDDLLARSGGAAGDLVFVSIRNSTAGDLEANVVADVQAV